MFNTDVSLAEALGRLQRVPASMVPRLFMMTDSQRLRDPIPAADALNLIQRYDFNDLFILE